MISQRSQESALAQVLSLLLLLTLLCVIAPFGFAYALLQCRAFWWAGFGAAMTIGGWLLFHH